MGLLRTLLETAAKLFHLPLSFAGPDLVFLRPRVEPEYRLFGWKEALWGLELGEVVRRYDVNLVLDVGAARGRFGRTLRDIGYAGLIHSFEPATEALGELQRQAAGDPLWLTHSIALGATRAEAEFHIHEPVELSSFLNTSPDMRRICGPGSDSFQRREVVVERLDALLPSLVREIDEPRIFLKMDTQGYDLQVFAGLGQWEDRVVVVQSELMVLPIYQGMSGWRDSIDHFQTRGFSLAGFSTVGREPGTGRLVEMDCLMIRPETARGD